MLQRIVILHKSKANKFKGIPSLNCLLLSYNATFMHCANLIHVKLATTSVFKKEKKNLFTTLGLISIWTAIHSVCHTSSGTLALYKALLQSCKLLTTNILKLVSQSALVVKNPPVSARNVRDVGSVSGLGRFPGGGHSSPLQYSCLENPMDRGTCWAMIYRVTRNWT